VQSTKVVNSFGLNIYDLLYHEKLIISKSAVEELEQLLGPKKDADAGHRSRDEAPAEEKIETAPIEAAPAKPKRTRKPKVEAAEPAESESQESQAEEGGVQE
jgi:hypothetical protein